MSGERGKQESSLELQQTTAPCSVIQTVPQETTELNGQYSLVEAEPQETTEPHTPLYSVVQTKELPFQTDPQQSQDPNAVVQKKPKQTKKLPVEPHNTTELNDQYPAVQEAAVTKGKDMDMRKEVASVYLPCQNAHNMGRIL